MAFVRAFAPLCAGSLSLMLGLAAGCERRTTVPDECVVWVKKDNQITGQVYMRDGKASFTAGASRRDVGYMGGGGTVIVSTASGNLEAGRWDGNKIDILYIMDSKFESETIGNGAIVIRSDLYKANFRYNSACDQNDAVVGAVTLMTQIFKPGEPTVL